MAIKKEELFLRTGEKNMRLLSTLLVFIFFSSITAQSADWRSLGTITVDYGDLVFPVGVAYRMGEYTPQISMDIDNDGFHESVLLISNGNEWGVEFTKYGTDIAACETLCFTMEYSEPTFEITLHDFDADNIPEMIISQSDGFECIGYVFKFCGSGVDVGKGRAYELTGWLKNVGDFHTFQCQWHAKDNILSYKSSMTGYGYSSSVYIDNKLRRVAED